MILTKDQERSKEDKKRVRIRKSRCVELDKICYYIGKFHIALSLCEVLGIILYFIKSFSKAATRRLAVAKVL